MLESVELLFPCSLAHVFFCTELLSNIAGGLPYDVTAAEHLNPSMTRLVDMMLNTRETRLDSFEFTRAKNMRSLLRDYDDSALE